MHDLRQQCQQWMIFPLFEREGPADQHACGAMPLSQEHASTRRVRRWKLDRLHPFAPGLVDEAIGVSSADDDQVTGSECRRRSQSLHLEPGPASIDNVKVSEIIGREGHYPGCRDVRTAEKARG